MAENPNSTVDVQEHLKTIMDVMANVITKPVEFFKGMPKTGGLQLPLVFMVAMGLVAGLVRTIFGIAGFGPFGSNFGMALAALIVTPIAVALFGFVVAAVLFGIWKLLGSQEPFETAYRCCAATTAISPLTALVSVIPYVGSLAAIAWMTCLIVIASSQVHGVEAKKAWIVFGAIGAILALSSISSELTARRVARNVDKFQQKMGDMQQMSPEEMGKKVGEFMKGMEEGSGKKPK